MKVGKIQGIIALLMVLTGAALLWLTLPVLSINFIQLPILVATLGLVIGIIGGIDYKTPGGKNQLKLGGAVFTAAGVLMVGMLVYSWSFFHWETQKNMLTVETKTFSESVSNVDLANLVILDEQDAIKFSEKLITEKNPALGSVFSISETYGTLSVVDGKPFWIFPLEHSGFFKWLSNKDVPGYLKVNATTGQSEFVEKTYSVAPSAFFGKDLKRSIYFKYPSTGLTDYSFEVDEAGDPYWVITAYTHKTGYSTKEVTGAVVVNAATGEDVYYEAGKQPEWIDRVFSLEIFQEELDNWGKFANGWWNPSDTGKLRNTEGFGYVFNEGNIYFYTGITSYGGDEATTGFIIFNPRTGVGEYNKISGSIETKAIGLMEELVQNAGYTAKFPYLININGEATYFSTLKGNSNNVVGYSFASVQNYRAVAWGKTLKEAQTNYARALVREGGSANAISEQSDLADQTEGIVSRVGMTNEGYYLVKLVGNDIYFIVSSDEFPAVALTAAGDTVKVKYLATEEKKMIDAIEFVNNSIQ